MNTKEINEQIQLAMHYKHENKLQQAIVIEEECLEQCKQETGTTADGIAMLFKALGKLYYVTKQTEKAKQFFIGAIELNYYLSTTVDQNFQVDLFNCAFFLGVCNDHFLCSKKYQPFLLGLQDGRSNMSLFSQQETQDLTQEGLNMVMEMSMKDAETSTVTKILGRTII